MAQLLRDAKAALKKSKRIDYYALLEIDQSASEVDIKKGFRRACLKWHPDKVCNQYIPGHQISDNFGVCDTVESEFGTISDRLIYCPSPTKHWSDPCSYCAFCKTSITNPEEVPYPPSAQQRITVYLVGKSRR